MGDSNAEASTSAQAPSTVPPLALTVEQRKQVELNRLRAKATQRQREQDAATTSNPNANNKRTINGANNGSSSSSKPLKRDSRLGKYFEYDLSKMVNSKAGFLLAEGDTVDEDLVRKEKERELQRRMQEMEPPILLDPSLNPKCRECGTVDINQMYRKVFGCLVCKKCEEENPDKYSLLTKTECKEDYLLTDPELRDHELLPHLLKANPHKSTYANMMLYLRYQIEEFAWKKWGTPEALDEEYERRTAAKKKKKNKKFEESLRELRRRTKETIWQRHQDEDHKHEFGEVEDVVNGVGQQVCQGCGFSVEVELL
ncbi:DNA repair protein [Pluteus cervinus]|uniref:DNA repair protein n=1 Tax=Pluteus cervinus TaxID=181527 RepID=A0ACD3BIF0_9AGAR|nr:DNA repair protein [Pluteus cervinus]